MIIWQGKKGVNQYSFVEALRLWAKASKDFYDLPCQNIMVSADNQRHLAEAPGLFELFFGR